MIVHQLRCAAAIARRRGRACRTRRNRRAALAKFAHQALPAPLREKVGGIDFLDARMRANVSAPSPTSMTWGECAITSRASVTGWRVRVIAATAPAARVRPSMIDASSSLRPSAVNTAPRPALNNGLSSSVRTAVSAASSALPPPRSTAAPASSASARPARSAASVSSVSVARSATPAPP
jgi:hypothetical protein